MYCPWGAIQHTETLERGIAWVSTAGHGGLRIAQGYAESMLSDRCIAKATAEGKDYLWYEEDIDWAYAILDLPHLWSKNFRRAVAADEIPHELIDILSAYDPEYLEKRGIKPKPELVVRHYAYKLQLALEAAGDPDAIRSAISDPEGITVCVETADEQIHHVTYASYTRKDRKIGGWLNLLSDCVEVAAPVTTDPEPATESAGAWDWTEGVPV